MGSRCQAKLGAGGGIFRVALATVLIGFGFMGCLLADFENGPGTYWEGGIFPDAGDAQEQEVGDEMDPPDVMDEVTKDSHENGDFCDEHPDGTVCGEGGKCHEMVCSNGVCEVVLIPDGVECEEAPNTCWNPGRCEGGVCGEPVAHPEGYNWNPSETYARCCSGNPLMVNTNDNCGICGIKCDLSDGQSCRKNSINDRYYCEGCKTSAKCWSGCCSMSYGQPYRCAASDCKGNCITCPTNATCVTSNQASYVCAYD